MIADSWKTARIALLGTTFAGVLLVLVKSIFYPASSDRSVSAFDFPQTVPLSGWQVEESSSVSVTKDVTVMAAWNYRYLQDNLSLEIKMYYLTLEDGGMNQFIEKYAYGDFIPGKVLLRQQEQTGFYSLWHTEDRVNLGACINPRGGSTVTGDQFRQNRNIHDLQFSRILFWLIGLLPLRDWRCLWTTLSVPIETGKSPQEIYPVLEQAWFSWYEWWQPRFPQP